MNRVIIMAGVAAFALSLITSLVYLERNKALKSQIATMEAQNAQLQFQMAAMAEERDLSNRVLVGLEKELRQIQGELSDKQDKLANFILNSEENRAWAGTALPDDIAGLFDKPGSKPSCADSTSQPVDRGAGTTTGRGN